MQNASQRNNYLQHILNRVSSYICNEKLSDSIFVGTSMPVPSGWSFMSDSELIRQFYIHGYDSVDQILEQKGSILDHFGSSIPSREWLQNRRDLLIFEINSLIPENYHFKDEIDIENLNTQQNLNRESKNDCQIDVNEKLNFEVFNFDDSSNNDFPDSNRPDSNSIIDDNDQNDQLDIEDDQDAFPNFGCVDSKNDKLKKDYNNRKSKQISFEKLFQFAANVKRNCLTRSEKLLILRFLFLRGFPIFKLDLSLKIFTKNLNFQNVRKKAIKKFVVDILSICAFFLPLPNIDIKPAKSYIRPLSRNRIINQNEKKSRKRKKIKCNTETRNEIDFSHQTQKNSFENKKGNENEDEDENENEREYNRDSTFDDQFDNHELNHEIKYEYEKCMKDKYAWIPSSAFYSLASSLKVLSECSFICFSRQIYPIDFPIWKYDMPPWWKSVHDFAFFNITAMFGLFPTTFMADLIYPENERDKILVIRARELMFFDPVQCKSSEIFPYLKFLTNIDFLLSKIEYLNKKYSSIVKQITSLNKIRGMINYPSFFDLNIATKIRNLYFPLNSDSLYENDYKMILFRRKEDENVPFFKWFEFLPLFKATYDIHPIDSIQPICRNQKLIDLTYIQIYEKYFLYHQEKKSRNQNYQHETDNDDEEIQVINDFKSFNDYFKRVFEDKNRLTFDHNNYLQQNSEKNDFIPIVLNEITVSTLKTGFEKNVIIASDTKAILIKFSASGTFEKPVFTFSANNEVFPTVSSNEFSVAFQRLQREIVKLYSQDNSSPLWPDISPFSFFQIPLLPNISKYYARTLLDD
ncbi:hypothetical protein TRFO_38642 [Tritrichomonas foetus]|uniref:Uncharacterized protein n=1 Tax=Tritrichomonas foetus TaxID=1144522 RepID=A0A1J4JCX5_9EUKA|nr:hypothetical protein TRFO_38642 [Tritrichomonas foetus]|eukprot:OHS95124.1 hypothetical protein TRFO_38642 [Tritrichomonas foetus]